jgi:amidase
MEGLHGILLRLGVWLLLAALTVAQLPELLDATLAELRHGLDSGLFTSVDLTKAYIARIEEVNDDLHAVNEINPDALVIAAELDAERKNGKAGCSPLHGIPVLIKDNIATNDKMNNTAGSYALLGATVPQDSTIAAKLRKSGVIILGKANLSQWANYRSILTSNGWSSYTGQTIGGYFPGQDPSGSSSGSGVSSSLGLAWACLGSETSGSIISPSNENNLVGIKPTVGLTSRFLVVPISEHQDTVGPMARTVKDAAYLLQAIAGKDSNDNYTSAIPFDKLPNYGAACKESGLEGKRIGISRNLISTFGGLDKYVEQEFNNAIEVLKSAGATIVDDVYLPGINGLIEYDYTGFVLGADIVSDIPKYFAELETNQHNIHDLRELQTFTQNHPLEEYPARDTDLWQRSLDLGTDNTSPEFWEIYQRQLELAGPQGLTGALKNHTLDAIMAPGPLMAIIAAYIGSPVITVPLGKSSDDTPVTENQFGNLNATAPNQPFGLGFAGDLFSEETLIEIAYAFEQKTNIRKQVHPYIVPKTELKDVME